MNNAITLGPYAKMILQVLLIFIMLSVALDIDRDEWKNLKQKWWPFLFGLFLRIFLLPLVIFAGSTLLNLSATLQLGLILVACCPGGNLSNFMVSKARGDLILSILLSLGSSCLALITTPFFFEFWSKVSPSTATYFSQISIDPVEMMKTISFSLLMPLGLGLWISLKHPAFAKVLKKKTSWVAPSILLLFIVFGVAKNRELVFSHFFSVLLPVAILNCVSLLIFYFLPRWLRFSKSISRAMSLEVSVENTSLALIIALEYFPQYIEVTMVAALWGLWQIISGSLLAIYWQKKGI
ncbi:MAG: bile acid:sodium symporter [Bacteriovoracaceae bacterium]|nr:bile acid:sodium symporter [Bacteriovoracaceae bacterium]